MKKIFVVLLAVTITATSFANPVSNPVSKKVLTAFQEEFKTASNVQWTEKVGLYMARFELNSEAITAWYNEDGELEAVQRTVTLNQINLMAARAIQQLSTEATVTTIAEVSQQGELFYLVNTETEKQLVTYKILADGSVTKLTKKRK